MQSDNVIDPKHITIILKQQWICEQYLPTNRSLHQRIKFSRPIAPKTYYTRLSSHHHHQNYINHPNHPLSQTKKNKQFAASSAQHLDNTIPCTTDGSLSAILTKTGGSRALTRGSLFLLARRSHTSRSNHSPIYTRAAATCHLRARARDYARDIFLLYPLSRIIIRDLDNRALRERERAGWLLAGWLI